MLGLRGFIRREPLLTIFTVLLLLLVVVSPRSVYRALVSMDYRAVYTLLALLIVSKAVELSGAVNLLARRLLGVSRGRPFYILSLIIVASFLLSGVFTNDAVLFIVVPLVLAFSRRIGVSSSRAVVLVVAAANIGSMISPIGNPQNIIIWKYYDVPIPVFLLSMAPYGLLGLVILLGYAYFSTRKSKRIPTVFPGVRIPRWKAFLSILLLLLLVAACELEEYILAGLIVVATLLVYSRSLLKGLDYFLLLMFIVMFIDFTSLSLLFSLGTVKGMEAVLYGVVLSQFLSNVPATIMLVNQCPDWYSLAVGVNLGGLFLVTGSFANIIGIRLGGVGVREFQKEALPIGFLALLAWLSYYLLVSL